MKKTLSTFALLLCLAGAAFAGTVSESEASSYARQFFNSSSVSLAFTGTAGDGQPGWYAFNNPDGGWVMISADDVAEPVLGYNWSGSFVVKGMPDNLSSRLGLFSEEIRVARERNVRQSPAVKLKWESVGVRTRAADSQVYLETAEWNQGDKGTYDYNMYCPTVTGESSRSVTGCVATAMAIVLRYNQWPQTGKGTLDSYSYKIRSGSKKGQTYSVSGYSIDGRSYDYSKMPAKEGSWTREQWQAVATLMHDCGVMVQMEYSCDGSGAVTSYIGPALAAHMRYSASAREIYRSGYNQLDWFKMLKAEIDADRPIIYGGSSNNGGHQFVMDGYSSDGKVHINWGWGGCNNGWYALNCLGDTDIFNQYDSAFVGLSKDGDGSDKANSEMLFLKYTFDTETFNGITLKEGTMKPGSRFSLGVGALYNSSGADGVYYIKLCVVGKDSEIKYDLTGVDTLSIKDGYLTALEWTALELERDPEIGDHIALYQRLNDGSWVPVSATPDVYMTEYRTLNRLGLVDVPVLYVKDSYKAGEVFYFNNLIPGHKPVSSVSWYFDGISNTCGCVELRSGVHSLKVKMTFSDGTTATLTQKLSVD